MGMRSRGYLVKFNKHHGLKFMITFLAFIYNIIINGVDHENQ